MPSYSGTSKLYFLAMDGETKLCWELATVDRRGHHEYVPSTDKMTPLEVLYQRLGGRETNKCCRHEGTPET